MYWKNPAGFEPANSGTRGQHASHQTTKAVNCYGKRVSYGAEYELLKAHLLYHLTQPQFWHGYVLCEEGTASQGLTPAHCILLIAHIALCKSRLTPAHCVSLIVYLTSYTLHLTPYILHLTYYILHLTYYILHLTSYMLHLVSYRIVFCTMWHVYVLCVRYIHDPMLLP
jgi:hypothetical protein